MSRVLKSSFVTVDADNRVKIDVMELPGNAEEHFNRQSSWKMNDKEQTPTAKKTPDEQYADELDELGEPENEAEPDEPTAEELLAQAALEADNILRTAQTDADGILRQAQESAAALAAEIEAQARNEGHEAGYAAGLNEAGALKEEAMQILDEAARQREQLIATVESELLVLTVKVVNKLLTDTMHINPQVIMVLIRQGLAAATTSGDIVIRVSPQDYDTVLADKDTIAKQVEASSKLEIIKDLSLNPCDCVIETPYGNIDCSLDRQREALLENLYRVNSLGE